MDQPSFPWPAFHRSETKTQKHKGLEIFQEVQVQPKHTQPHHQCVYKTIPTKDCEKMPQHFGYQAMEWFTNEISKMGSSAGACKSFSKISHAFALWALAKPHFLWACTTGTAADEQAVKTNLCLPRGMLWVWDHRSYNIPKDRRLAALEVINLNFIWYYFREAGWGCG